MTKSAYLLLGLTAVVAVLAAVLAFAILRTFAAARNMAKGSRDDTGGGAAFMTGAMEEALARLKVREQALAARAEASERLSDEIVASLTSGLLVVSDDHRVKSLNPAGSRLLGMPEGDWSGDVKSVLRGAAAPLASVIEECLSTGRPIRRRQVRLEGPAGAARIGERATYLGVSVSPIGSGAAHGAICLFSDLTDIMELEEQLRLRDSLAQVGELTAGIAHEFRNGLATIHGYARLLELEKLPANMRPYVQGIRDETDMLGAIVRNFLNFAKPAELVMGTVDVRAVAERVAEEVRADVASQGGGVIVRGEFATVPGDEVLLKQAFSNLSRNALEACSEARVPPRILIEGVVDRPQSALRVAFIDNGPGVDPALASRIFHPFVTTRARGTGLGLALVQKIVVTHNGRVSVQPEPGGGTRFIVTLPLESAER
jgi:signal transduction histidine kinase